MTSNKIFSFPEYETGLYEHLKRMGDRRFAERKLATRIYDDFSKDPSLSKKERNELLIRADRMMGCRVDGFHGIRKNKLVTGWTEKCGQVRLCPDESRAEGARLGSRYLPTMMELADQNGLRCFYAVLTIPNAERGELRRGKLAAMSRWTKLWDRMRKGLVNIGGGTVEAVFLAMEDPLSAADDWNIHINVLLFIRGGFDYGIFRELWGYNVEIRQVNPFKIQEALLEVVKYSVKHISGTDDEIDPVTGQTIKGAPGIADWDSAAFAEWWKAGQAFKRVRTYGKLNGIKNTGKDDEESELDDSETVWFGRIRYGTVSQQYTTTYRKNGGLGAAPNVDLIMVDKSGLPRQIRLSEELSFENPEDTDDISMSRDGINQVGAVSDLVDTVAQPLPLTRHTQKTLSHGGSGRGFVPDPHADTGEMIKRLETALKRAEISFELRKGLHPEWFKPPENVT